MLVTIRPSELCGMESRLPPDYRKPSYTTITPPHITTSTSSVTTSHSTIRLSDRNVSSSERDQQSSASRPAQDVSDRPSPSTTSSDSTASQRSPLAKTPSTITTLERTRDSVGNHGPVRRRKKKHGVFGFLSTRGSSGNVLTKHGHVGQEFVKVSARHASSRLYAPPKLEEARTGSLDSSPLRDQRRSIRPSLSGFLYNANTTSPVTSPSAPRRLSLTTQSQKRLSPLPSHSTTATGSTASIAQPLHATSQPVNASVEHDLYSVEDSFLFDFKRSPAAAYMFGATSGSRTSQSSNQNLTSGPPHVQSPDAASNSTPRSAKSPAEDIVVLSSSFNTPEDPDAPDGAGWPSTSSHPKPIDHLIATHALSNIDQSQRRSFHVSSDSQTTNSTVEAVTSPTFSTELAITSSITPPSSVEIQRHENDGPQQSLLVVAPGFSNDDAVSIAPSEASEQWNQSPRERLGLGGNLKKVEVSPWEVEEAELRGDRSFHGSSSLKSRPKRFSTLMNGMFTGAAAAR